MNIKVRIMNLVNRALAEKQSLEKGLSSGGGEKFSEWMKRQDELENELNEIDKAAGKGLCVGRCLSFGVADGTANYIITKIRKHDVVVEWVPLSDGYFSDAVGLSADRRHYVVNRATAERLTRHDPLNPMFGFYKPASTLY